MNAVDMREVVKVVVEGTVTSFRYPHFIQGVQPTFEMPPPSTIYGHICSALGRIEPPEGLAYASHFTHEGKFRDLEHLYLEVPMTQPIPFQRELLFSPRLTLYLEPVDRLYEAFRKPRFPVILGRSQDLMTYTSVDVVSLQRADRAYFEHTLIPEEWAPHFQRTVAVTMARYIDPRRHPTWDHYAILIERVLWPPNQDDESAIRFAGAEEIPIWVDPQSPPYSGDDDARLGLVFHTFV